jgi:polysaccharide chain length determinant protein (PEP-CTERM system associated)
MEVSSYSSQVSGPVTSPLRLYVRYARRTLKYPGTIAVAAALVLGLALGKHFLDKKLYESSTVILIQDQKISEQYVKAAVDNSPDRYINTLTQQVLSRSRLEKIVVDMDLYPDLRSRATMDEVIDHTRSNIQINVYGKESFRVTYLGEDPKVAQAVCSRLADIFITENSAKRTNDAEENMLYMSQQAKEKKRKLEEIEEELRGYKEQHLGTLPSQETSISQDIASLTTRLESISEDIRDARRRMFVAQSGAKEVVVGGGGGGGMIKADPRAKELAALRGELTQLKLKYTDQHPDVIALKRQINTLQSQVGSAPSEDRPAPAGEPRVVKRVDPSASAQVKALQDEIAELEAEKGEIKVKIDELRERQSQLPRVDIGLQKLEREREALQKNYTDLLNRMEEAERAFKLEKQNQGQQFKVLDPANLPTRAAGLGLIKLGGAGFALGILVGLGLALGRVMTDPHIYELDDLQRYVDVEVLAVIPRIPAVGALPEPKV